METLVSYSKNANRLINDIIADPNNRIVAENNIYYNDLLVGKPDTIQHINDNTIEVIERKIIGVWKAALG